MLVLWLCLPGIFAALLACSATALGARGHVFEKVFSEPCLAEPCERRLKRPAGVAVNEASGDVYVVDKGANRVARFDQSGEYISEFNGSGEVEVEGVKIEGKAAGSGGQPGEIETGRFEEPEGIAVDNSCTLRKLSGKDCEDPSNGDVYVADAGFEHRVIDKYSPSGEYLGQLTEAGGVKFNSNGFNGVAVDTEGKVWVYRGEARPVIDGFSNAAVNKFIAPEIAIPGLASFGLPGVAVDSKGAFYTRRTGEGPVARISKFSHSGQLLIEELDEEDSSAVAVDQTDDTSFVDNISSIRVSNPEGVELERLGQEEGAEHHLTEGAGIGVNAARQTLYVADAATDTVLVFGPTEPGPPTIESESVANVAAESAELGAEINPRSEAEEAPTEYHFEYGACTSPSSCPSSPYERDVPDPEGKLGADFEAHAVVIHIQGLKAGTTYHFRTVAKNARGRGPPGQETLFTTQSAGGQLILPDERGWELVSPPDKHGALIEPISETGVVQAAGSGEGITYLANAPTEAEPQGYANQDQILSRRSATAWSTKDIAIAHSGATGFAVGPGQEYKFFDTELSTGAVQPFGEFIPELSAEASESTAYLHDLGGSCGAACYRPLVTGKPGFANVAEGTVFGEEEECIPRPERETGVVCGPRFLGASEDLSHVVVSAKAALKSGAAGGQLYEWAGGTLTQVSVLPGGESAPEGDARLGLINVAARGAISSDGSRIVWGTPPALYLRDMSRGETVQLDQGEAGCGECESGEGHFQFASSDGSRVFFTDVHKLSKDAGSKATSPRTADLYECKITLQAGKLHCALADLTPERGGESAEVQGGLLGGSEDGEYLYFVAKGALSEAQNSREESAVAGKANLYLRHGATTSFITTLADGDEHDWDFKGGGPAPLANQPTRVSPNGQFLALMSEARLSGYDNRDVTSGKPAAEVFIYDAASNELSCASCEPSGGRPVGVEYALLERKNNGLVGGPRDIWPVAALVAANVPGWTAIAVGESRHQPRYLTDSGRLFFNTADGLVSQDSNATQDVYQYEPPGAGDCTGESADFNSASGGCVSLISSGGSAQESAFMDASETGDDVFFLTAAKLSPLDTDAALDIYDAHVCSDSPCIVAAHEEVPPCSTEASCKASPTPQPSIFGAPSSATFSGPGNPPAPVPPRIETKAEKLAKALKACRAKKNKHKRRACEKDARRKYGAKAAKKPKHKTKAKRK